MTKKPLGTGRVAFLARKDKIEADLVAGWPVAEVYRRHQKDVPIGQSQFERYVQRFIVNGEAPPIVAKAQRAGRQIGQKPKTAAPVPPAAVDQPPPEPAKDPLGSGQDQPKGFRRITKPNTDDLI